MIYETAVYCGSLKVWRIFHLLSGTLYSSDFETEEAALATIEDGEERAGKIVKRVRLRDISNLLKLTDSFRCSGN
jgi:hypothetical protein